MEGYGGALALLAIEGDVPTHDMEYTFRTRKSQTDVVGLGREEGPADLFEMGWRDARPGILNTNHQAVRARPDLDGQYAVFGRVIRGGEVPSRLERGDLIVRMSVK